VGCGLGRAPSAQGDHTIVQHAPTIAREPPCAIRNPPQREVAIYAELPT
jgi:hypothetical protein